MRKRTYLICFCLMCCVGILTTMIKTKPIEEVDSAFAGACSIQTNIEPTVEKEKTTIVEMEEPEDLDQLKMAEEVEVISRPLPFPDSYYDPDTETYREEEYWDDMELVALVCVAEAEGESELGKRLVIDTIFNRADSPHFPNTIREVVYAPDQYECVWNGRLDRVEYNEYIANLVMEELENRTNSDVIYFKTEGYFNYGIPIIHEGHHYFSGR